MSKARPRVPIMAFTPELSTYQRMGLYWGVTPFLVPFASNVESMITHVEASLISSTTIQPGEQVVMISGLPVGAMRPPNFALLHTIGETIYEMNSLDNRAYTDLITTSQLAQLIDKKNLVIIDCRFDLAKPDWGLRKLSKLVIFLAHFTPI